MQIERRRTIFRLAAAFSIWFVSDTQASIVVSETGQRYYTKGYAGFGQALCSSSCEYTARLQYIYKDPWQCQDDKDINHTVTVPADGMPVALLVQRGVCTLEEMFDFVLNRIQPSGVIQYIILAEPNIVTETYKSQIPPDVDGNDKQNEAPAVSLFNYMHDYPIVQFNDDAKRASAPLSLIRVSLETQISLLDNVIVQQSQDSELAGGPCITLDNRSSFTAGDARLQSRLCIVVAGTVVVAAGIVLAIACSFRLHSFKNREQQQVPWEFSLMRSTFNGYKMAHVCVLYTTHGIY